MHTWRLYPDTCNIGSSWRNKAGGKNEKRFFPLLVARKAVGVIIHALLSRLIRRLYHYLSRLRLGFDPLTDQLSSATAWPVPIALGSQKLQGQERQADMGLDGVWRLGIDWHYRRNCHYCYYYYYHLLVIGT